MRIERAATTHRCGSGTPRAARAVLAGGVVAACAATAHVLAGGQVPGTVLVVVLVGAAAVAHALGARRLGSTQVLGLLVIGQATVHLAASQPAALQHAGHAAVQGVGHTIDAAMLAAHVMATLVSLVVLRHGEDAWWRLADHLGLRATPVRAVAPPAPDVRLPAPRHAQIAPRLLLRADVVQGRAPPVGP